MKVSIEERAVMLARYIIETEATVRSAAKFYGVSKSTVHKDIAYRLEGIDRELFVKVRDVLEKNKSERHIRGGMATKRKYLDAKQEQYY